MKISSGWKRWGSSLVHLFIPQCCAVCGKVMVDGEHLLCTSCRWNMPLTYYWNETDNPVWQKLNGIMGIYRASSLFYYRKQSGYDTMIYRFKYKGSGSLSLTLGRWFGEELKRSGHYTDIDLVLPVPLHPLRLLKRGYNQSELLARGIGRSLGVRVSTRHLKRTIHNRSQTHHNPKERWENVKGIFSVRSADRLTGKHILLVDDVLTTGATLESCVEAIRSEVGECRISVVTIATASKDTFKTG